MSAPFAFSAASACATLAADRLMLFSAKMKVVPLCVRPQTLNVVPAVFAQHDAAARTHRDVVGRQRDCRIDWGRTCRSRRA
jgi:hypothetical protein